MSKYKSLGAMIDDRLWAPGKGISAWDGAHNYVGADMSGWVVGVSRTRDSDALDRANFDALLALLGGEQETKVRIARIGHWACGWVDQIQVRVSASKALATLLNALNRLDDYPVLDETLWSEYEDADAQEVWKNCYSVADRIEYIREHRSQFEFRSLADLLGCVRGHYFAGYASELIGG